MSRAVRAMAVLACAAAAAQACRSSSPTEPAEAALPGPPEWNRDVVPPADDEAAAKRAAGAYAAGALPAETQGESRPMGAAIPIDHVVVIMQENRSFDHYFQAAKAAGIDVDVAPEGFTNPDAEGKPVAPHRLRTQCFVDTAHSHGAIKKQVNGGKMDGFVLTNEGAHELPAHGSPDMLSGARAMGYYDEEDLPFVYWAARNFAVGDRYFASLPTATWPNRMFLYAAHSFGLKSNEFPSGVTTTIVDMLEARKVRWKVYAQNTPTFAVFLERYLALKDVDGGARFGTMDDYYADLANGALPAVAFLDPDGTGDDVMARTDEHPPSLASVGQSWLAKAIAALKGSSAWARSAVFVTYDEHGGLYDHVPPPKACPPDDRPLDEVDQAIFGSYGVRVPFLVISPYAKKGYVSHRVYDHTSILRFLEARFTLPAMSRRDANAEAPWDVFDFAQPDPRADLAVPIPPVDEAAVAGCRAVFD